MKTREDVWEAFADQFLDTETRTWIPRAALTAVEAGFSRAEAYDVWRFEVTPAVSANLLDLAGEWAGWPRDWLVKQIWRSLMRPSRSNLYTTFFVPTFRPLASESIVACDSRVMRALAQNAASGPYRTSAS